MRVRGLVSSFAVGLFVVFGVLVPWCGAALAAEGSGLIDGRGWEQVSPVDKHGAGVTAIGYGLIQAAEDGSAIAYVAGAPTSADPAGHGWVYSQALAKRGAGGWSSQDIATPHEEATGLTEEFGGAEYSLFSSDLSLGLTEPPGSTPLGSLAAGAEKTIYLRENATGGYLPLVTAANIAPGAQVGKLRVKAGSSDLKHVVFTAFEVLAPGGVPGGLYEWSEGALKSVAPSPSAVLGFQDEVVRHTVSDDGSRVIWESESPPTLYLTDTVRNETVQLDAVQGGSGSGSIRPMFQTASTDGSRIFFTDSQQLTADAPPGTDLYVFEVSPGGGPLSGTLRNLPAGESASVVGIIPGASDDGSYVYFVSNAVLAPGAVPGGCRATNEVGEGECNMYVEHRGPGGWEAPKLVSILSGDNGIESGGGTGTGINQQLVGRVSPNGRYLAFMTSHSFPGYDNRDAVSGEPDWEAYLYDATTGHVTCVSCDPTGARPTGVYDLNESGGLRVDQQESFRGFWLAGSIPAWSSVDEGTLYQSRFLADNGRLFFDSPVALVPGDVNGKEDVYEFEPSGVGGCQAGAQSTRVVFEAAAGGCVGLISSGTSGEESAFVEASASAADVFFVTAGGLVPQDGDGGFDLYDAPECTSASPCAGSAAVVSSPPCATPEACRGALSSGGLPGAPGSATFSGSGNLAAEVSLPVLAAKPKAKALSRAQKLARALKACRKRPRAKRAACEKSARRAFGARLSTAGKATARVGR